jgi:acetyltransferase-like isoleucine patch superfamily enzyme
MSKSGVFVHPQAIVESGTVGAGTRVWAFAHVCKAAIVGTNCNIGEACYIEGGSRIGNNVTVKNGAMIWEGVQIADDAFIGPGVVFTNDLRPRSPRFEVVRHKYAGKGWLSPTKVGRCAAIGANAAVTCGITIGEFAMIGAGSMVTGDVPPHALAFGNPARVRGHVCVCGERLAFRKNAATCGNCGVKFRKSGKEVLRRG